MRDMRDRLVHRAEGAESLESLLLGLTPVPPLGHATARDAAALLAANAGAFGLGAAIMAEACDAHLVARTPDVLSSDASRASAAARLDWLGRLSRAAYGLDLTPVAHPLLRLVEHTRPVGYPGPFQRYRGDTAGLAPWLGIIEQVARTDAARRSWHGTNAPQSHQYTLALWQVPIANPQGDPSLRAHALAAYWTAFTCELARRVVATSPGDPQWDAERTLANTLLGLDLEATCQLRNAERQLTLAGPLRALAVGALYPDEAVRARTMPWLHTLLRRDAMERAVQYHLHRAVSLHCDEAERLGWPRALAPLLCASVLGDTEAPSNESSPFPHGTIQHVVPVSASQHELEIALLEADRTHPTEQRAHCADLIARILRTHYGPSVRLPRATPAACGAIVAALGRRVDP